MNGVGMVSYFCVQYCDNMHAYLLLEGNYGIWPYQEQPVAINLNESYFDCRTTVDK